MKLSKIKQSNFNTGGIDNKFSFLVTHLRPKFKKIAFLTMLACLTCLGICVLFTGCSNANKPKTLVLQSDYGNRDSAVSAMKGVAMSIDNDLRIFDNTHEIEPYNIYEGSYRINQSINYWPEGTVFVSVIDPGVGSERNSIVAKTKDNKYITTPNNGTLTMLKDEISEVRVIDETKNRLPGSEDSCTFDGRDVYAYTAARLASGQIKYEDVGSVMNSEIVTLDYKKAQINGKTATGSIDVLDINYGNVWTNIDTKMMKDLGINEGAMINVKIFDNGALKYQGTMPLCSTFSDVTEGQPLAYYNSLSKLSFALNMENFAEKYGISAGEGWTVEISS